MMRRTVVSVLLGCYLTFGADLVTVTVPAGVTFQVDRVNYQTAGSPAPSVVSYSTASLQPGRSLKISVIALAPTFTGPPGTQIPASSATWTLAGATGGSGFGGTISYVTYTVVFMSNPNPTAGSVSLNWKLYQPPANVRAGSHTLLVQWKFESI